MDIEIAYTDKNGDTHGILLRSVKDYHIMVAEEHKAVWYDEVVSYLSDNKKVNAIKVYRSYVGGSLKDCKAAVDALQGRLNL